MSVSAVVKAVSAAAAPGLTREVLAARCGLSRSALGAKLKRGSFSADDLVRVAAALGVTLAFVDADGHVVVPFRLEDAAPPRRAGVVPPGCRRAAALADQPAGGEV